MSMRIAEVAARSGVPATTLRYYDQLGLVPSDREPNGYRVYSDVVLERLRFIEAARRLDLPLAEIGELLVQWESEACASVKARLRPSLDQQIERVDSTIGDLSALLDSLRSARDHLDVLPDSARRCDPSCAFLMSEPAPAIACELGEDRQERVAAWRALLASSRAEPIRGGVRFEMATEWIAEASRLAVAEQHCCPFFGLELVLRGEEFVLTIRSPEGAHGLLQELTGIDMAGA